MLNLDQLHDAVAAAKRQFELIRKKYPDLKAYLVLSLPGGQTGIDSPPKEILCEFPAMIVNDKAKRSAQDTMSRLQRLEWQGQAGSEKEILEKQLEQLSLQFQFDEKCQIEIRFVVLNYELVWKLQEDDLIDRDLTPHTKASIRIVLGTLSRFLMESNS